MVTDTVTVDGVQAGTGTLAIDAGHGMGALTNVGGKIATNGRAALSADSIDDTGGAVEESAKANGVTITDFAGNGASAGDQLRLVGYGTAADGATIVQQDATHWSINSADGSTHDIITLRNAASLHLSDFMFV